MKKSKKVNVDDLTVQQVDELSKQLGDELAELTAEAVKKANKKLKAYGLMTKMQLEVLPLEVEQQN